MMTNHGTDDERRRRRVGLLWFGGAVALLLLVGASAYGVNSAMHGHGHGHTGAASAPTATTPVSPGPTAPGNASTPTAPATTPSSSSTDADPSLAGSSGDEGVAPIVVVASSGGGGNGTTPPHDRRYHLVLASSVNGPLRPGIGRTLHVSVRNPNRFAVTLVDVDVRVNASNHAGCLASWVTVGHYRQSRVTGIEVSAHRTRVVDLPISLVNLPYVNQDVCKGASYPLGLSAVATERRR